MSNELTHEQPYDVIVVGYGAAGASAAIEAADAGARVLVLDRGYGGGASALSGGVVYAGGGTRHQKAAGLIDTPGFMFDYLRQEVGDAVSERTLRAFCESSVEMVDWLEEQGAEFRGTLCPYKTSYPTDNHYLYYSGNEKAWPFVEHATPAARGHRQLATGLNSGKELFARLSGSAMAKGVHFLPLSRVQSLIIEDGQIAGVKYRTVDRESAAGIQYAKLVKRASKLTNWAPWLIGSVTAAAEKLWQENGTDGEARARTVVLSAGGFIFNPEMKAKYAGDFADLTPLGTEGDDGSGITLGVSAGGSTDKLERMTAWRFMSPPNAFLEGVTVGPQGGRIANEDLYGTTHSDIMIREHQGKGFLLLDSRQWNKARKQLPHQTQLFQRLQAAYLFSPFGHKKAKTISALAKKLGVPAEAVSETVNAYNEGINSGTGDPAHKAPSLCTPVAEGPFYAINIAIKNAFAYPTPGLTLGGLRVDETTGEVLRDNNEAIAGLYAAGRNAIGICSNNYISGLSLADCIYSGRRAGRHAASVGTFTSNTEHAQSVRE
ncbi:FAD-binding protein [Rhodococcus sp. IEGM 1366]|uniref:FAD-binding protein n=1 Tax=Rhodococcus sp. IEGM 1366 TaxID=3082223 RepID=UPI002954B520|nr:FAD-binding protein [Rhodococcus sp. IEGM 1366]MDV8071044.1 FAD-binding protein [Rhodococcus sp. IEGM 1366]